MDEVPTSNLAIAQPTHRISKKLVSSQTAPDRGTDSQQDVRHTTCGALSNSHGVGRDVGLVRGREGEAKPEDDPKLTGAQKMCYTVHPSITLGNTFPDACIWLCLCVLSSNSISDLCVCVCERVGAY